MTRPFAAVLALAVTLVVMFAPAAASAQQTSTPAIDTFHADITIDRDDTIHVTETIAVDFGAAQQHGIFRDIPVDYAYDGKHRRVYDLKVVSVKDAGGNDLQHVETHDTPYLHIRIGDPNHTVTGKQTYSLAYNVEGALNGFPDHDELYWNVTGSQWPMPIAAASVTVSLPSAGFTRTACYQGVTGSTEPCPSGIFDDERQVLSGTTRTLATGEQLTVVAAVRKGVLAEPQPHLVRLGPKPFSDYFAVTPPIVAVVIAGSALALFLVAMNWWRNGRDRVYRSMYYLTDDPSETTRPLFHRDQVVVEYTPPDDLRAAPMGLLLDERLDDKDIAATIVDLAVRGYLSITELRPAGFLSRGDWQLTRQKKHLDDLTQFERTLVKGIFGDREEVAISALHTDYPSALHRATDLLIKQCASWFAQDPRSAGTRWHWYGAGALVLAVAVTWAAARGFDGGLVGIPVALAGIMLILSAPWMAKRTAKGSEMLRRVLGFRLYIATAETRRQEFNEKANIFAEYLPYAIVFGCVTKWAQVFRDIDVERVVSSWYVGSAGFNAARLSTGLHSFSQAVSVADYNSLVNTPGGQGRSGFFGGGGFSGGGGGGFGGGGFAGGGGGGGGGGAW